MQKLPKNVKNIGHKEAVNRSKSVSKLDDRCGNLLRCALLNFKCSNWDESIK